MLSIIYYIFLVILCTTVMILSAVVLLLTSIFSVDKGRRVIHELSRYMTFIFYGIPRWKNKVEGLENVDKKKSYVIVLNHQAMIDIPSLYYVPLNFRWVSKREVFKIPFFGQFLLLHGDISINRGRAQEALNEMCTKGEVWVKRGASVAVFPEGTRSKDGEIHRFKAGAFTLAKHCDVEILPVVLDGTSTLIHKNRLFNWKNRITVKVLKPVSREEVQSLETHELMENVRERMVTALAEIRSNK